MLKWGTLGSNPGKFNWPGAVPTDELGNGYVVDQNNHRVQKFDRGGAYLTQWGSIGVGNGQFYYPCGIAGDLSGNVYVGDGGNYRVQKFSSSGAYLTQWGSLGTGPGQIPRLSGNAATEPAGEGED